MFNYSEVLYVSRSRFIDSALQGAGGGGIECEDMKISKKSEHTNVHIVKQFSSNWDLIITQKNQPVSQDCSNDKNVHSDSETRHSVTG